MPKKAAPRRLTLPLVLTAAVILLSCEAFFVFKRTNLGKNRADHPREQVAATPGLAVGDAPPHPPENAPISDAVRRDLQEIFVAGDRSAAISEEIVVARRLVERDEQSIAILLDRDKQLAAIGRLNTADNAETDSALAKKQTDQKHFRDDLARYVDVQVLLKTKIDFLQIPSSSASKKALQETSVQWTQLRTFAERPAPVAAKTADKIEEFRAAAVHGFDLAKNAVTDEFLR